MTVNHKDGNRYNNRLDNLEWLSIADNIRHGFENDLFPQKHCKLISIDDGREYEFRSLSQASQFLKRSHGYISNNTKKGKDIIDINGLRYKVILKK